MSDVTAHVIEGKWRSDDIKLQEQVDFSGLMLSEHVLCGLKEAGFIRPSPIQLHAIPLGRCGLDLIIQAKSGTGKTCVMTVIALENIELNTSATQVLILTPTREIAVQNCDVILSIGRKSPGLKSCYFIGGIPVKEDHLKLKKCHIAVGTPGRIQQLINEGLLKTDSVRLFVLDEADKLLEESFQTSINWIYSCLPSNKQILALSATYPEKLAQLLTLYMRNPMFCRLNVDKPSLLGLKQFYKVTPYHPLTQINFQHKIEALTSLFHSISFSQCLVFSNYQLRAESLSDILLKKGWPTAFISGSQEQSDRLKTMNQLKNFKLRVLVSTDLTARGIDAENVNLVVNLDVPWEVETYLHRIGRAGRFGSQGLTVTLASEGKELEQLMILQSKGHLDLYKLPDPIPNNLWNYAAILDRNTEVHHIKQSPLNKLNNEQQLNNHDSTTGNEARTTEKPGDQLSVDNNLLINGDGVPSETFGHSDGGSTKLETLPKLSDTKITSISSPSTSLKKIGEGENISNNSEKELFVQEMIKTDCNSHSEVELHAELYDKIESSHVSPNKNLPDCQSQQEKDSSSEHFKEIKGENSKSTMAFKNLQLTDNKHDSINRLCTDLEASLNIAHKIPIDVKHVLNDKVSESDEGKMSSYVDQDFQCFSVEDNQELKNCQQNPVNAYENAEKASSYNNQVTSANEETPTFFLHALSPASLESLDLQSKADLSGLLQKSDLTSQHLTYSEAVASYDEFIKSQQDETKDLRLIKLKSENFSEEQLQNVALFLKLKNYDFISAVNQNLLQQKSTNISTKDGNTPKSEESESKIDNKEFCGSASSLLQNDSTSLKTEELSNTEDKPADGESFKTENKTQPLKLEELSNTGDKPADGESFKTENKTQPLKLEESSVNRIHTPVASVKESVPLNVSEPEVKCIDTNPVYSNNQYNVENQYLDNDKMTNEHKSPENMLNKNSSDFAKKSSIGNFNEESVLSASTNDEDSDTSDSFLHSTLNDSECSETEVPEVNLSECPQTSNYVSISQRNASMSKVRSNHRDKNSSISCFKEHSELNSHSWDDKQGSSELDLSRRFFDVYRNQQYVPIFGKVGTRSLDQTQKSNQQYTYRKINERFRPIPAGQFHGQNGRCHSLASGFCKSCMMQEVSRPLEVGHLCEYQTCNNSQTGAISKRHHHHCLRDKRRHFKHYHSVDSIRRSRCCDGNQSCRFHCVTQCQNDQKSRNHKSIFSYWSNPCRSHHPRQTCRKDEAYDFMNPWLAYWAYIKELSKWKRNHTRYEA
ncbi:uncharacterized protein LOC106475444 isoform X2 [Limulus polyphemus]|uniref:RNA helicase n=1 Tax=Limulus polyphemus TaxID=6850 RepID=A0ABM1RYD7_LIMPO|nr:uncharacterized protein LOC106475444 isoform X2 [Limulus polyphemus]